MNNYDIETSEYIKNGLGLFQCGLFGDTEEEHVKIYCQYVEPKGVIVDMGCGIGTMGALINEFVPNTMTINVTNSTFQAKYLEDNGRKVILSDYKNIPLPDGFADFVMFNESFGYGGEDTALAEAARILKVGGSLAIKDYSHTDKISDGEYIDSWEYMIYPMSKILQKAELLNLRLDFMIHPDANVQKCHVFLANSKLKDWHDIDYRSGRTMLCKFTKI
jgi:SAM-dependent methyltransferase